MKALLGRIDWARPWLEPYREVAAHLHDAAADARNVADLLNHVLGGRAAIDLAAGPLHFVPQARLLPGEAYEAFIARTAGVPTRDNLHDLFNGLVWLRFPRIKRRLNELQAAQIGAHGVGDRRGAQRDALTLFDENGAWLQAPAPMGETLRARDWRALFVTHRSAWREARLTLFGHALIDKLCNPRPAITAHVWLLPQAGDAAELLFDELSPARLATRPHQPLPVLGVPGWWAANADVAFYADATVFRPPMEPPSRGRGEVPG